MGNNFFNPADIPPAGAPPPAADVPPANQYTPASDLDAQLNHVNSNLSAWQKALAELDRTVDDFTAIFAFVGKHLTDLFLAVMEVIPKWDLGWENLMVPLMEQEVKELLPYASLMAAEFIPVIAQFVTGTPQNQQFIAPGGIGTASSVLIEEVIKRMALMIEPIDPSETNAGIRNAQYLLQQGAQLAMGTWALEHLQRVAGMGMLKHFADFENVVFQSINPANMVRMMMDAVYTQLVRLPMTRDYNRLYPIKDLGVAAWAKLYFRGGVSATDYQSHLLDAGLNATQAQQLLLETFTPLNTGDVGTLVVQGQWTSDQALTYLAQIGFPSPYNQQILWLETHRNTITRERSVGTSFIDKYKKGQINFELLTQFLTELHFEQDEIAVISLEHTSGGVGIDPTQVDINGNPAKDLSYTEVKDLFARNLVDLDYVITFLQNQGYSAEDLQLLILLDFTASAELESRLALLSARERVLAQEKLASAATAAAKNEADLAAAETAYAKALQGAADLYGTPIQS